jgi:hypothetical protein
LKTSIKITPLVSLQDVEEMYCRLNKLKMGGHGLKTSFNFNKNNGGKETVKIGFRKGGRKNE